MFILNSVRCIKRKKKINIEVVYLGSTTPKFNYWRPSEN